MSPEEGNEVVGDFVDNWAD